MPETENESNVYVIRHEKGFVKIGRSKSATSRCKDLQTACPFNIYVEAVIPCLNATDVESTLHNHLEEHCVRGEWFDLPDKIDAWLGSLYFLEGERLHIELESGPDRHHPREIKSALRG